MDSNLTQHTPITKRILTDLPSSQKKESFETISTLLNSIAVLKLRNGSVNSRYLLLIRKNSLNDADSQLFKAQLEKLKDLGLAIRQYEHGTNPLKTRIGSDSTNLKPLIHLDSSDLSRISSIENEDVLDADEKSVIDLEITNLQPSINLDSSYLSGTFFIENQHDLDADKNSVSEISSDIESGADASEYESEDSDSDTQQRVTSYFLLQCAQFSKNKPGIILCMLGVALLAIALGATCLLGAGVAHAATVLGYAGGAMMLGGAAILFFNSPKPVGSEPAQIQTSEPGPSV